MIMPTKFIQEDEALIGVGAILLKRLSSSEKSLSDLWENTKQIPNVGNFERFILTLDLLFMLDLIVLTNNKIMRKTDDSQNLG